MQNYIDNTGVQVADVVVGFLHLEGKAVAEVRALVDELERSRASGSTTTAGICMRGLRSGTPSGTDEENEARKKLRYDTLHAIEQGGTRRRKLPS